MATPSLGRSHVCNKKYAATKPSSNSQSFMVMTYLEKRPLIQDCFFASGVATAFAAFASSRQ